MVYLVSEATHVARLVPRSPAPLLEPMAQSNATAVAAEPVLPAKEHGDGDGTLEGN